MVRWYLATHYERPGDPGTASMFCDPARLGAFAIDRAALLARDGATLFKLLVAIAMFQRRQDVQIAAILRSLGPGEAAELTDHRRLLELADASGCAHASSATALAERCDLTKHPVTKRGLCASNPAVPCALKRHTEWMRRYGHFGKVPTSAALVVRDSGAADLAALLEAARQGARGRARRAEALEAALSRTWRVSAKISAMFLSLVTNPDLTRGLEEWAGVDWRRFVVVDSNVDLFLAAIRYRGPGTYEARRGYIRELSRRINLREFDRRLRADNPRIVQQAMFLFMSAANRRSLPHDCMHRRPDACGRCDARVAALCPVRLAPVARRRSLPVLRAAPGAAAAGNLPHSA